MTTGVIIRLVLVALVFLAWAAMTFSVLSKLRRRDAEAPQGLGAQVKHWWQNPDDRQERNTLVWLALVLVAMLATNLLL